MDHVVTVYLIFNAIKSYLHFSTFVIYKTFSKLTRPQNDSAALLSALNMTS